jgi:hypothetical protein
MPHFPQFRQSSFRELDRLPSNRISLHYSIVTIKFNQTPLTYELEDVPETATKLGITTGYTSASKQIRQQSSK